MNFESPVKEITSEAVDALLSSNEDGLQKYEPEGLFISKGEHGWTAIDNSSGDAFTESFREKAEAEMWLRNPYIFGVPIYRDGFAVLIGELG